jgi:hypothetical protein
MKKLGLGGAGGKVKGKAFNQLINIMNEGLYQNLKDYLLVMLLM